MSAGELESPEPNSPTSGAMAEPDAEDIEFLPERGLCWLERLQVNETKQRFSFDIYTKFLDTESTFEPKILKDINRTFPRRSFFTDEMRVSLFRIVNAYAVFDKEVGYSQGMAFIAGFLRLHMTEEDAFWALVVLFSSDKYNLRILFDSSSPSLSYSLVVFQSLFSHTLPRLAAHFAAQGVDCSMYAVQWFVTLYVYRFPLKVVFHIWDFFIRYGVHTLFLIGVSLLAHFQDMLLQLQFDEIVLFFNKLDEHVIPLDIVEKSTTIRIPDEVLELFRRYGFYSASHSSYSAASYLSSPVSSSSSASGVSSPTASAVSETVLSNNNTNRTCSTWKRTCG